jgi:hypothetical protein
LDELIAKAEEELNALPNVAEETAKMRKRQDRAKTRDGRWLRQQEVKGLLGDVESQLAALAAQEQHLRAMQGHHQREIEEKLKEVSEIEARTRAEVRKCGAAAWRSVLETAKTEAEISCWMDASQQKGDAEYHLARDAIALAATPEM